MITERDLRVFKRDSCADAAGGQLNMHDATEQVRERLSGLGVAFSCSRGCSGCCDMQVPVGLREAVAMAEALSNEQMARVRAHARRVVEYAGSLSALEFSRGYRTSIGPCPLLTSDGACGAYGARPLTCRSVISTMDPAFCAAGAIAGLSAEQRRQLEMGGRSEVNTPGTPFVKALQKRSDVEQDRLESPTLDRVGYSIAGVLSVMLTLVTDPRFWSAFATGDGTRFRRGLVKHGLWHPVLLQIPEK